MAAEPYRDRPSCAHCGTAIELDVAQYSDDGRQICADCVTKAELSGVPDRIRSATSGAAWISLGLAVGSYACGGIIVAGIAIAGAVGALGAARSARAIGEEEAARGVTLPAVLALVVATVRVLGFCAPFLS